jgi:acyl-CoA reductase-like NAD-dependent aldehyde dehydrogenase
LIQPRPVRWGFRPYFFGKSADVTRVPLGVIGVLSPWNVPLSLAMGAIAPALAAGNAVVAKPSEYAPLTVLALAEAFAAAGLPPGVLNVVTGGPDVGRQLVDAEVDRTVFTGSARSGLAVYRALAERGRRPPVLELGGKDAMVVCADADLDYAAQGAVWNAFSNTGQQCCSVERVYVVREVAEAFLARVTQAAVRLAEASGFTERDGRLHDGLARPPARTRGCRCGSSRWW